VIRCAPLGILGLVASTSETGFDALFGYAQLLVVLIGCMLFIAFVVNPLIVFWKSSATPSPGADLPERERRDRLLHPQLRRNIPVNMALARGCACRKTPMRSPSRWVPPSTWPAPPSPSPC
jgi:serine/threonine transporter